MPVPVKERSPEHWEPAAQGTAGIKNERQASFDYLPSLAAEEVSIENLLAKSPPDGHDLIRRAWELADRLHAGQVRLTGEPYVHHPLTVATYLAELNLDAPTIAAGLLHDVLEDTEITLESLAQMFPDPVPQLVQGVTKISKINFRTTREAQVENLRMMLLAMAKDIRVVIVKLCDRLHNMQTLKVMAPERRLAISQETVDIYAPLANRLGMSAIRCEMEDLAMRWLHPEAYRQLAANVAQKRAERSRLVEETIQFLRDRLEPHIPGLLVTGRPKHFYSIYKKMKSQGLTFDQIYDLNAIRVICPEKNQCYDILGMIHDAWAPIPGRFKDYIGMPKKNDYQSLHTTVVGLRGAITEIQIRTRKMHEVAELGVAAHWRYKEKGAELQDDSRLEWVRRIGEWITDSKEPESLLDALKRDVFADHALCFTPKGDVIELPAKATPIDFAYAIHTKVGEQCVGAKINGRMVNLRHQLQHGDVVDIITASNGHPSRDWLQYAVTGRALQKIKHWLKTRHMDEWVEQGRASIMAVLRERNIRVGKDELDQELAKLLPAYKYQNINDVLVEIGFGSLSVQAAVARMNPAWTTTPERKPPPAIPGSTRKGAARVRSPKDEAILIEGAEGAPKVLAKCCSPIPGDEIVGFIRRGRPISIHREHCPTMMNARKDMEDSARILPAMWHNLEDGRSHTVTLRVESEDRNGLLNAVTGIITNHGMFIKTCRTNSDLDRGTALLLFQVTVSDTAQLERCLTSIRQERGILAAERRRGGLA